MMAFLIGVAVGFAVGFAVAAWYCTALMDQWNHRKRGGAVAIAYRVVRYAQWQHTLIAYAATISRIHARWIITDTLGTFEGHPMEELVAFLHRYSTTRTSRTTRTTPWTFAMTSWPWYAGSAATSATRTTRTTPRSTTLDATEER